MRQGKRIIDVLHLRLATLAKERRSAAGGRNQFRQALGGMFRSVENHQHGAAELRGKFSGAGELTTTEYNARDAEEFEVGHGDSSSALTQAEIALRS